MEKIAIIGAGGHARSVMDIIQRDGLFEIAGCLDPCCIQHDKVPGMKDIRLIGDDDMLGRLLQMGIPNVFVAIGANALRRKLTLKAEAEGLNIRKIISLNAVISPSASIGRGTCVMPGAVLNVNSQIGEGCIVNTNCSVDHDGQIGDYVHIAPGTAISGMVTVGNGTHIGTNAAVIDGISVGAWSYIGAGAAVVKDIPDHVMAYGVPAKIIKNIE